jgi:type II secretory pathway pseudopilin PulG
MELGLALALLAVFFGVFVPVLAGITRERRLAAQEQVALQHAANLLDELSQQPADELARSAAVERPTPPELLKQLPGVEQTIQTALEETADAVRITVSVRWQTGKDTWSRPMVLSAWAPAGDVP